MDKHNIPSDFHHQDAMKKRKQIISIVSIVLLFLILLIGTFLYTKFSAENANIETTIKDSKDENKHENFHHSTTPLSSSSSSPTTTPSKQPTHTQTPSLSHSSSPSPSPPSSLSPSASHSSSQTITQTPKATITPHRIYPSSLPSMSPLPDYSGDIIKANEFCFRMATYNIREGAHNLKEILTKYIIDSNIDILALQELNGWEKESLSEFGKEVGHNFTVFINTTSGYHMGFTSRFPFEVIRVRTEGFHHGMIHINMFQFLNESTQWKFSDQTDDDEYDDLDDIVPDQYDLSLHLIVTHLDPHSEVSRLEEAHHIIHQAKEHRNLLLFGDLNSLSILDKPQYDATDLLSTLLISSSSVQSKFLTPDHSAIDYQVMNKFYDGEMWDANEQLRERFMGTVPTPDNDDINHAAEMRLDYILSTSFITPYFTSCFVDKNNVTSHLSDHYPVLADICYRS